MNDLLVYRMQCRAAAFWRDNPAKVGLCLALIVCACMAAGMGGAIALAHRVGDGMWAQMAVIIPSVSLGAYSFFQVSERWIQMVSREEQQGMLTRLPRGTVPTRRLCKLEAYLIEKTQDPAHHAHVVKRTLDGQTRQACATQAPRRL